MEATKATEQRQQDSRQHDARLDNRYGKIGISAVAAAIRQHAPRQVRQAEALIPYDRD
jgi:hypothetical protein